MEAIEGKVSKEQRGLKKRKGCVDQIFAIIRIIEECLGKDENLYAVFMDLDNEYD